MSELTDKQTEIQYDQGDSLQRKQILKERQQKGNSKRFHVSFQLARDVFACSGPG